MLKDLNLGRYYDSSSFLHRLDPRTKLVFLPVFIICAFLSNTVLQLSVVLAALIALIALSKVPLRFMFRGFRTIAIVILTVDVFNIIFLDDGLHVSILLTLRMLEVILASNLLTLTTRARESADGLEKGLGWLRIFRVPVHDLATMVSIAFRFVPILTDEARDLMDAQSMRGADFSRGNFIRRAKALGPLAITVFAAAFRRADELSLAMDSRLYGMSAGNRNSKLNPLRYGRGDAASYICIFCFLAVIILLRIGGI